MITIINKMRSRVAYSKIMPGEFFALDNGTNLYYRTEEGYIHIGQTGNSKPRGDGHITRSVNIPPFYDVIRVEVEITIS